MAVFASISLLIGWPTVSYSLFASGIAAVVLTDHVRARGIHESRQMVVLCIAFPCFGMLGGFTPALILIVPVAALAVVGTEFLVRARIKPNRSKDSSRGSQDNPLTNLCVSLPSAIILTAIFALG